MAVADVPATFTKFPASLAGPFDDVEIVGGAVDWEVELVAVHRHAAPTASTRPTRGRTWPASPSARTSATARCSSPPARSSRSASRVGATARWGRGSSRVDEVPDPDDLALGCSVDGETMQDARTSDLIFSVPRLIAELSAVLPLLPGDIIFTGTPAGIGATRQPPRFLQPGQVLETWIEGIGTIRNRCV